jgi:hypothetical protein
MNLTYILIDYENVKPTAADLKLIRGAKYQVRIFHGPHQNKFDADTLNALLPVGGQVKLIQSERSGKNALDFHIAFYLGRLIPELPEGVVSAMEKPARFIVVSKDSGFDVLLSHVRELGYDAARVISVREALLDETTDAAAHSDSAASRKPEKAVKQKPVPTAEKTPAVKAVSVKPKSNPPAPQLQEATPWSRVIEHLRNHPDNRPSSIKTLERHLATVLGKETSQEVVKDLMARLQREGVVVATGKKIEYKIPE